MAPDNAAPVPISPAASWRPQAAVAERLNEAADLKAEATPLRARLEKEQNPDIASSLARAYAAVAARLNEAADLKAAATALRGPLEKERDRRKVSNFVHAYATVALGAVAEGADRKGRSALVQEILMVAGHPFIEDVAPLLAALKPAAGMDFGANQLS